MKLILCTHCNDVLALRHLYRTCVCGRSSGYYKDDGLNAVIEGAAVPLGFANSSFISAVNNQPEDGMGETFTAFVIPKRCPTVEVK